MHNLGVGIALERCRPFLLPIFLGWGGVLSRLRVKVMLDVCPPRAAPIPESGWSYGHLACFLGMAWPFAVAALGES